MDSAAPAHKRSSARSIVKDISPRIQSSCTQWAPSSPSACAQARSKAAAISGRRTNCSGRAAGEVFGSGEISMKINLRGFGAEITLRVAVQPADAAAPRLEKPGHLRNQAHSAQHGEGSNARAGKCAMQPSSGRQQRAPLGDDIIDERDAVRAGGESPELFGIGRAAPGTPLDIVQPEQHTKLCRSYVMTRHRHRQNQSPSAAEKPLSRPNVCGWAFQRATDPHLLWVNGRRHREDPR